MSIPAQFSKKQINAYDGIGEFKASFGRAGKKFLRTVGKMLEAKGYEADGKGVRYNEGGIAVSGEVTGIWFHPDRQAGIYVSIEASCCRASYTADNGLLILYRANSRRRKYDGFQNCYANWDIDEAKFAGILLNEAERNEAVASR